MSPKYSDSPFKMIGGPTALASVEDWPSAPGFYTWAPGGKKIPVPDGMTPQEARARYMAPVTAENAELKRQLAKRERNAKGFAGKIRFAAGAAKPFGSKHEQRNAS